MKIQQIISITAFLDGRSDFILRHDLMIGTVNITYITIGILGIQGWAVKVFATYCNIPDRSRVGDPFSIKNKLCNSINQ